jgi:hypothetical protein
VLIASSEREFRVLVYDCMQIEYGDDDTFISNRLQMLNVIVVTRNSVVFLSGIGTDIN